MVQCSHSQNSRMNRSASLASGWRRFSTLGFVALIAAACAVGFWVGLPDPPPAIDDSDSIPFGPPWFEDVTAGSGINFTYMNGEDAGQFTILESVGGGIALLDYDGDGLLDVFITGGGHFEGPTKNQIEGYPCKLFRNLGGWKFQEVTREAGLERTWPYTHGAAVADFDRDGYPDLLVTGFGRLVLLHNEPDKYGGRMFVDVTDRAGLKDDSWSTSAGWGDIDGDGFPDLYVCHYCDWSFANHIHCAGQAPGVSHDVCPPERFKPLIHALFKNESGKSFRNVSAEHGFAAKGNGLGVVLVDVNDDSRPDIYVANDANNKFLFMNRGGRLEENALIAGVAIDGDGRANGSMGVDAGDYDGSGRPSLWVSNFQRELHGLYRNTGRGKFEYVSKVVGLAELDRNLVGFGTGFIDANNDGWEDLIIAHGHVLQFPPYQGTFRQYPLMLRNDERKGQRYFRDVSARAGAYFQEPTIGRGLAIGDLDNDGWPDVVVSHSNSPVALLRNVVVKHGPARWVGVRLVGRGNRDVVGSTITLESRGRVLTRFAKGGGSYLSASDSRLLFGLGNEGEPPGRVTVKWSWGESQTWEGLEADSYWELHEGKTAAKKITASGRTP